MPRQSTLSNPTGLIDLEKKRIGIQVDEGSRQLSFSLTRLDISDLKLAGNLNIVVIARKGNSEQRLELGSIAAWDKSFIPLPDLGADGSLIFRVLLLSPGSPKLVAAAEHIRPIGDGDSESFIALEPADLKELPWEILVHEQEGRATIRFNREIFLSSSEAESNSLFISLLLPEAVRAMTRVVSTNPGLLSDEAWQHFSTWLHVHGVTEELNEDSTEEEREHWCSSVTHAFCNRFEFVTKIKEQRQKELIHES